MSNENRYIFQGHAVGAEARRPGERKGWIHGAMALPVTGGYGQIEQTGSELFDPDQRGETPFTSASAFASGEFIDDAGDARGPTRTVTAAYVSDFKVLQGRVRVKALSAHLVLDDLRAGQPRFTFGVTNPITQVDETKPIVGLTIDGCLVNIKIDPIFSQLCTLEELQQYFRQKCNIEWYGGVISASIVQSLSWADREAPEAKLEGNTISISGLGRIYLGELLIEARSRRLTLLRVQSGSDGLDIDSGGGVQPGPQPWPSTGS